MKYCIKPVSFGEISKECDFIRNGFLITDVKKLVVENVYWNSSDLVCTAGQFISVSENLYNALLTSNICKKEEFIKLSVLNSKNITKNIESMPNFYFLKFNNPNPEITYSKSNLLCVTEKVKKILDQFSLAGCEVKEGK